MKTRLAVSRHFSKTRLNVSDARFTINGEPFRRGFNPQLWNPKAEDFMCDLQGAKREEPQDGVYIMVINATSLTVVPAVPLI